jgi:hypothetical protein
MVEGLMVAIAIDWLRAKEFRNWYRLFLPQPEAAESITVGDATADRFEYYAALLTLSIVALAASYGVGYYAPSVVADGMNTFLEFEAAWWMAVAGLFSALIANRQHPQALAARMMIFTGLLTLGYWVWNSHF